MGRMGVEDPSTSRIIHLTMARAVARWSGRKTGFTVEAGSGHQAAIDEPPILGEDSGMRPTEMLLGALGGCTGINAVLLLKKFEQAYRSLAVEVEGDQEPEWPHRFTAIRATFAIEWEEGFEPDQDLVEKALDLACNRYCPVHATLSGGSRISHGTRSV
jgi:putative redox protein